jgi:hypothetical protein
MDETRYRKTILTTDTPVYTFIAAYRSTCDDKYASGCGRTIGVGETAVRVGTPREAGPGNGSVVLCMECYQSHE